jgi:choline monooxygenase
VNDSAGIQRLRPAATQLPIDWYIDPKVWEMEDRLIFDAGARYVGHELMVPEPGDYRVLDSTGGAKVLVRDGDSVKLLSNVCRHRQAKMLDGAGNTGNIVCPVHRWTYDLSGRLLGAPKFPETPCLHLERTALTRWNGLLFEAGSDATRSVAKDLAGLSIIDDLDFAGYRFDHQTVEYYDVNWKTFIEVYLEDYHVAPAHPGLGHFVDCDDLRWEFGEWYSVQIVGVNNRLAAPGSPVYARWHEQVLRQGDGKPPKYGAVWLTYYPNVMIEWYPHVLVVSSILPQGPERCANLVEFYYPEAIALFEREFIEAERAAYLETAAEDREICERMQAGRKALWRNGRNEVGPYHSPYEDGMQHFHEFVQRQLNGSQCG